MIDSVTTDFDLSDWIQSSEHFVCDVGNRSLSQHLTRPLKIASLDVPITYYYFICKVLGGFLFFSVGGVVERFLGVACHVPRTRIRVKLELK